MHYDGFLILLVPLMGLNAICRNGKWNWNVVASSKVLNGIVWLGWFSALLVGLVRISGIG